MAQSPPGGGVALVTGASSGIGEQFARQLSARGHELILVARRADRLEALAADLPTDAHVIPLDLAAGAAELKDRVAALGLRVDLLVNNAGFGNYGRFWEVEEGRDAESVRVNCEAIVTLTQAFIPDMVARGSGGIIIVASSAGILPDPLRGRLRRHEGVRRSPSADALHTELRGTGVRCLAVNPGPVPTEWQGVAGFEGTSGSCRARSQPTESSRRPSKHGTRGRRTRSSPARLIRWVDAASTSPGAACPPAAHNRAPLPKPAKLT